MLFAHDTEVALQAAAALVNIELVDVPALQEFVAAWRWTGSQAGDAAELAAVQALRLRLRPFWGLDAPAAAALVNQLLTECRALPQLVRHDGWDWHLHATPADAPLAQRMAVEAAMALLDVVRAGELGRLLTCAATGCDGVLVDLSKNRSRRFCGTACANRTNVAAFRARRAADRTAPPPGRGRDARTTSERGGSEPQDGRKGGQRQRAHDVERGEVATANPHQLDAGPRGGGERREPAAEAGAQHDPPAVAGSLKQHQTGEQPQQQAPEDVDDQRREGKRPGTPGGQPAVEDVPDDGTESPRQGQSDNDSSAHERRSLTATSTPAAAATRPPSTLTTP